MQNKIYDLETHIYTSLFRGTPSDKHRFNYSLQLILDKLYSFYLRKHYPALPRCYQCSSARVSCEVSCEALGGCSARVLKASARFPQSANPPPLNSFQFALSPTAQGSQFLLRSCRPAGKDSTSLDSYLYEADMEPRHISQYCDQTRGWTSGESRFVRPGGQRTFLHSVQTGSEVHTGFSLVGSGGYETDHSPPSSAEM
jgi:hypothetical protein